jgi:hypothetical protein
MSNDYKVLQIGAAPEPEFTKSQIKQKGTHVNKTWWAKCLSYDQVKEKAQRAYEDRQDIMVPARDIRAVANGSDMMLEVNGKQYMPTDWALKQFSGPSVADIPSSTVLSGLREQEDRDNTDAVVMAALANNGLRRVDPDKKFRLRTYKSDNTLRAVVTSKYAPIDNRWYLDVLQSLIPEGVFSHWRSDEDTLYGNILLPDTIMDYPNGDDSDYGGMISIGNCEIGKRRLSQFPSVFRSICFNGNIWGKVEGSGIRRRHIGHIDMELMKKGIAENIQLQMPLINGHIERFLQTKDMAVDNGVPMISVIAAVVDDQEISKVKGGEVFRQWDQNEREFRNLFGVINAITRAGQMYDQQTYVDFDEIGGNLAGMNQNAWKATLNRAATFDAKKIESILSVAV